MSLENDINSGPEIQSYMAAVPIALGKTLNSHKVTLVEEYPSPGSSGLDQSGRPYALRYPGARPNTSFALVGGKVEASLVSSGENPRFYINTNSENGKEFVYDMDDFLIAKEAATMGERFPVIAFGSNANPSQLAQKFKGLEGADKNIVPTMMAKVSGVIPVYSARIGINGYVFTDLFPTDSAVESNVHVNFLSGPQLAAMDATEKSYSMCELDSVRLQTFGEYDYHPARAYLYVGREDGQGASILADDQGRPIRLAEIEAKCPSLDEQFAVMSQTEVQEYIFGIAGQEIREALKLEQLPENEVELVKIIINRKDDPRLDNLKSYIKTHEPDQPLGRVVGRQIQKAISSTGRVITASGLRNVIDREQQDISLEDARTFSELSN